MSQFDENYFLRGEATGVSNYTDYRWLPELTLPMAKTLCLLLAIKEGQRLLDYGCARGYLVKALRQLGINAFGCDISEWAIANCDPEVRAHVSRILCDTARYDYVFCKDVLEHVATDELERLLPRLLNSAAVSVLLIVPLAMTEGGSYVADHDEKDVTHVQRRTADSWLRLVKRYAEPQFTVVFSDYMPKLKASSDSVPDSTGFIFCRRTT